jgi:MFS family permease
MSASRYKWVVVGLLWVAGLLNAVDRHSVFAVFPVLEKDLGMSRVELGLLGSAFLWAYAALGPFAGYVGDRFPRRSVIIASLFAWSVTTAVCGLTQSGLQLILLRVALAVSEAFYLPTALALLSDHHDESTRSKAIAVHLTAMAGGQVAGGFLGGFMAEHFGWRLLFFVLGGAGVLWVPVLALTLRAPEAAQGSPSRAVLPASPLAAARQLGRIATFRFFAVAFLCYTVVGSIVSTWLPYHLFRSFGMSLTGAGFSANFYLELPTLFGNLAGGAAGDHFAVRSFRGRMLTQAGSLILSAPLFLAAGFAGSVPQVAASLVLLGFLRGAWAPNVMPVICQIVPETLRATTYGVLNCLGNVAGGLAAVLAGAAIGGSLGLGGAIAGCALLYWIAAALLVFAATGRLQFDYRKGS